jgi:hypothetical protein
LKIKVVKIIYGKKLLKYLTLIVDSIWLNMIGAMSAEGSCP